MAIVAVEAENARVRLDDGRMCESGQAEVQLSSVTGYLKQLAFAELMGSDRAFFDACFPEFRRLQDAEKLLRESRFSLVNTATNALPIQFGRLRRFAGGPIGPGRYWTVCHDPYGRDEGTLMSELMAYWQPSAGYLVDLRDSRIRLRHDDRTGGTIRSLEIIADRYGVKGLVRRRIGRLEHRRVALRLSVIGETIDRVVDLRLPDTQRWFFDTFINLELARQRGRSHPRLPVVPVVAMKTRRVRDFVDLLPTLVMPAGGGGIFHQAVGAWLRNHDVNGLVYPSARRDAMMNSRDEKGSQVEFDGWNFVDYRGTGPEHDHEELFGLQPQWLRPDQIGITIDRSVDTPGWQIVGAEQRERDRYETQRRRLPVH